MGNIRKNKKGGIEGLFVVAGFILFIAIGLLIAGNILPQIADLMLESELNVSVYTHEAINKTSEIPKTTFDNVFLLIFVGLVMGLIITGVLIRSHPVFIPIFIIMLLFLVVVSVVFSNLYGELATTSEFNETATGYVFMGTIMSWLPIIMTAVGIIVLVVLFAKPGGGGV